MGFKNYIEIDEVVAERIADQVVYRREGIPDVVEDHIVEQNKRLVVSKILGAQIPASSEYKLVEALKESFCFSAMQPGESVGIMCAQSIGECVTQSALNTFHKAGLDTGVNGVMKSIEDIIDIPRSKTSRRPHIVTVYHVEHRASLDALYKAVRHHVTEVTVGNLVKSHGAVAASCLRDTTRRWAVASEAVSGESGFADTYLVLTLKLEELFSYRIDTNMLRKVLGYGAIVEPFSSVTTENPEYAVFVPLPPSSTRLAKFSEISRMRVVGIPGATGHSFQRDANGEWHVVVEGAPVHELFKLHHVYDPRRTVTNRVSDIAETLGVFASRVALQKMGKAIFGDSLTDADMTILATKITFNGKPMPCSRFTMRTNTSPLAKISFEESQGGCRNAGLFGEREMFNTLSSMVIGGKLPRIGSAISDAILDDDRRDVDEDMDLDDV